MIKKKSNTMTEVIIGNISTSSLLVLATEYCKHLVNKMNSIASAINLPTIVAVKMFKIIVPHESNDFNFLMYQ